MNKNKTEANSHDPGSTIAIGIALGAAFGVMFGNIAIGIALGIAVALAYKGIKEARVKKPQGRKFRK